MKGHRFSHQVFMRTETPRREKEEHYLHVRISLEEPETWPRQCELAAARLEPQQASAGPRHCKSILTGLEARVQIGAGPRGFWAT